MKNDSKTGGAIGVGIASVGKSGQLLDVWYPAPALAEPFHRRETRFIDSREASGLLGQSIEGCLESNTLSPTRKIPLICRIESLSHAPEDVSDVYLRLHLLSHRLIAPRAANLSNIFEILPNVAWTSAGPAEVGAVDEMQWAARRLGGSLHVFGIDKIPPMSNYVVPSGVRIADASRVRLGAHLSPGTTVLHEGFCNFNAGTLGRSMVEGRISAGVIIGEDSDIGGGASIMGTLSGGGDQVISVGRNCLLGANSGIGISLGDNCIVEAGCYVTAGMNVSLQDGRVVKARELSGCSGLTFRRNSQSGRLEVVPTSARWRGLNQVLHLQ